MTLSAVQEIAFQLPEADRIKLASALFDSLPAHREPVKLEELEQRLEEVESGKVEPVSSEQFDAHLARLRESIRLGL